MTGKCSICLSPFKEPVSIPCGHVYCTKCLADHVNTPGSEDTTSSCPTCRTVFNIVTPDLTYLPKKYHQYVVPSVRRVFLDPSGEATLQKKLIRAEARVRKLEAEQETLLKQCEKHMSAARAHAEGEMKERQRATRLEHDFDTISSQAVADNRASEIYIKEIEDERNQLKIKYQKLKKHCRDIEEQSKSHKELVPPEMFEFEAPRRKIIPLPRKRTGPMSPCASQTPIDAEPAKRPRRSAPGQLQAGGGRTRRP